MTLAFKEWSYIVDALGKGKQSIILRKGGISEEGGDFVLKGNKFILFPTLFHQAKEMIKPLWLNNLEGENFYSSQDKLRIDYFAEIIKSIVIKDWSMLEKLDGQHAWKEEVIKERFNRWDKSVHLLILQVYKLDNSVELEIKPEYNGCKSWINIEESIELEGKLVINEKLKGTF